MASSTPQQHYAYAVCVVALLVLFAVAPGAVEGSSQRLFDEAVAKQGWGICSATVTVLGYECHEHYVTTGDGYILNVQRIPHGRNGRGSGGARKPPVIIQHGVLVDGAAWFLNSADMNLPLILADNGFDVWIANTRGTRFSRQHTSMDASNPRYWDFSFDELVTHDLPATFYYVHDQTGQKINYIGHSMGTLIVMAAISEGTIVNYLQSVALLSPVVYLTHMTSPLGVVGVRTFLGEISNTFGLKEFDPKGEPVAELLNLLCITAGVQCYDLLTLFTGKNCCLDPSTIDLFLHHEPQPTSTKTLVHLSQISRNGVLAKYDHGRPDLNFKHYAAFFPLRYDLSNKIPQNLSLFISYGGQDALSDKADVHRLLGELKQYKVGKVETDFIQEYAHADFTMGINAKDLVYNKVTAFFKRQQ